jgi:hypothetical protein
MRIGPKKHIKNIDRTKQKSIEEEAYRVSRDVGVSGRLLLVLSLHQRCRRVYAPGYARLRLLRTGAYSVS